MNYTAKRYTYCTDCDYMDIFDNFTNCSYCDTHICYECFNETKCTICQSCLLYYNHIRFEEVKCSCPKCNYKFSNEQDYIITCNSCNEFACNNCYQNGICSQCINKEYFNTLKQLTEIKLN
jgi:hypothetical protein